MKTSSLRLWTLIAALWLLPLSSAYATGSHPEVPASLPGILVIEAKQVLTMMENGTALMIDNRKTSDHNHGTIPGALHCMITSGIDVLDDTEIHKAIENLKQCPEIMAAKPDQNLVSFCNGKNCWRSPKGSLALHRMGFQRVHWYRLGMNDWKSKKYPQE